MGCSYSRIGASVETEQQIARRSAIKNVENSISISLFRGKRKDDDMVMSEATKTILESELRGFFALDGADDALYASIGDEMKCEVVGNNKVIITEGEFGDTMYFLEKGSLAILKGSEVVQSVEPGEIFGEMAVIYECPRTASIVSIGVSTVWSLHRDKLRKIQSEYHQQSTHQYTKGFLAVPEFKNFSSNELFRLASAVVTSNYSTKETLYEMDQMTNEIILIVSGEVNIMYHVPCTDTNSASTVTAGKINLLVDTTVHTNFQADVDTDKILDQLQIVKPLGEPACDIVSEGSGYYSFRVGKGYVLGMGALRGKSRIEGSWQWVLGDKGQTGAISKITATVSSNQMRCCSISVDVFERLFGSLKKMEHGRSTTTHESAHVALSTAAEVIQARSDQEAEARAIDKTKAEALSKAFELKYFAKPTVIGNVENGSVLVAEYVSGDEVEKVSKKKKRKKKEPPKYILKFLSKQQLKMSHRARNAVEERKVLTAIDHVFICKLLGTVQTPDELVFVLERCSSGDIYKLLYEHDSRVEMWTQVRAWEAKYASKTKSEQDETKKGRSISFMKKVTERTSPSDVPHHGCPVIMCKFYIASVILAVAHMHSKGIVFRNISAENIMIDQGGYIKIVGFSLAKQLPYYKHSSQTNNLEEKEKEEVSLQFRTYTLCGTPEYMAPEVIARSGHDWAVDHWAIGVLLFELLCGITPFRHTKRANLMSYSGSVSRRDSASSNVGSKPGWSPVPSGSRQGSRQGSRGRSKTGSPFEFPNDSIHGSGSRDSGDGYTRVDHTNTVSTMNILGNISQVKEPTFDVTTLVPPGVISATEPVHKHCLDLVSRLLKYNPSKRLGVQYKDTISILSHSFFNGLEISDLEEMNFRPCVPFIPDVSSISTVFRSFHQMKLVGLPKMEQYFGGDQRLFEDF